MAEVKQKTKLSFLNNIAIKLLRIYQLIISPLIGPSCRFYPSCSQYSIQAFEHHGLVKGFYLSIKRLSKCHPGNGGGIDEIDKTITPQ
ncbi:MAG: membrane protein insertion efficiency factor YidD [Cellvibrionales bacterium]|nr:membrane protein insertion efficiency factor YidD [Cellvibrionales bacterium]